MTKLDAIRLILRRCGYGQPAALNTGGPSIAGEAERYLDDQTKAVLAEGGDGQFFNARTNVELTPDGSGYIALPSGTITIKSDGADAWRHITQLGDKLFDRDNNTDVFSGTLRVAYVSLYEFECAPEPIQFRIAYETAMQFVDRYGRPEQKPQLWRDTLQAQERAAHFHARTSDVNIFDSPDASRLNGGRPQHPGELVP